MKYWLTTDTHFGHAMLVNNKHRHKNYETDILENFKRVKGDVFIHLGDICIGCDEYWHEQMMQIIKPNFKKVFLVRGNHDNKSYNWYYDHGWDFVCEQMRLRVFGKEILLSHMPLLAEETKDTLYLKVDKNIHGHLHGKGHYSHRAVEGYDLGFNYDCAVDTHNFAPVNLEDILNDNKELLEELKSKV